MDGQLELFENNDVIDIEASEEEEFLTKEVEIWRPGKAPISLFVCGTCFIRDSCPFCGNEDSSCQLEELQSIDTTTADGILGFIETILAAQAKRILRILRFEEVNGGLPNPAATEELRVFVELIERLKKITSDDKDTLFIKAKGKAAQGIMNKIMGDIDE